MNELECIGSTKAGNALLMFPFNGELLYFEVTGWDSIRLHAIDTVQGAEQTHSVFDKFEDLDAVIRAAIARSQYNMVRQAGSLEGAMS